MKEGRGRNGVNRLFSRAIVCVIAAMATACGDDDGPSPPMDAGTEDVADLGATVDARVDDAGDVSIDARTDAGGRADGGPMNTCGDRAVDPGESCDDGNTDDGDGCNETCRFENVCGDGMPREGEVCDDGDRASGDGCRADCTGEEACGDGILDVAAGEVCDHGGTAGAGGCVADCSAIEGCGDATTTAPETCDDGASLAYDGCGADCTREDVLVVDTLAVADAITGCDANLDGLDDNAFGRALDDARALLNDQIAVRLGTSAFLPRLFVLSQRRALDDVTALRVSWLIGRDADGDPSNDFSGEGAFTINAGLSFDDDGVPLTALDAVIEGAHMIAGPGDVPVDLFSLTRDGVPFEVVVDLRSTRIAADLAGDPAGPTGLENGLVCGAVPVASAAAVPNFFAVGLGMTPPTGCHGDGEATLLDLLIAGTRILGIRTRATQPDVDLDGDGLETLEVLSEGERGCHAVVGACIDGDGTRIEGHDCTSDPRIADGLSLALTFTAVTAIIDR